jgi:hypothetical protein
VRLAADEGARRVRLELSRHGDPYEQPAAAPFTLEPQEQVGAAEM